MLGKRFVLHVFIAVVLTPIRIAIAGDLVIDTASGHEDEVAVAKIVRRLIDEHELADWMFTKRILIDRETGIPHSHPVLTLNTRYIDDETEILTNIVHEQIHWFVLEDQKALGEAIDAVEKIYPDAPDGPPKGARDLRSTYLHLIICSLEYSALEEKIGREAAEKRLLSKPYYTWVFHAVVKDRDALRALLERHGLVLP